MSGRALAGLLACSMAAGCSGYVPRVVPQVVTDDYMSRHPGSVGWLSYAVMSGCVVPGMPSGEVRAALGPAGRVDTVGAPSSTPWERWTYRLDRAGSALAVDLAGDTVVAWRAVLSRRGRLASGWRRVYRDVAERVGGYLQADPAADDNLVYAMLRGCPTVGMDSTMVLASLGAPFSRDSANLDSAMALAPLGGRFAIDSAEVARRRLIARWTYVLSREGDRLEVDLTRGVVSGWRAYLGMWPQGSEHAHAQSVGAGARSVAPTSSHDLRNSRESPATVD